ncbi:hypothetical protein crov249 [Cafeteria roenbergensis virus]|uniref:Uncharacterized protein n=1 Tax=Cafeteria roenbergensis virus (strain BV-PW1) TaxID=693272 RepID=E3T519_CROVB|nr:hypothetical protein crov249 [Cafeteria roenbergensis virus BV-PW1]ADO67282.1 hypothetical protein crov249 [Cafeteria roenbergensis virus BV-PW1]
MYLFKYVLLKIVHSVSRQVVNLIPEPYVIKCFFQFNPFLSNEGYPIVNLISFDLLNIKFKSSTVIFKSASIINT